MNGNFHVAMHPVTTPYEIASFMTDKLNLGEVKRGLVTDYLINQVAPRPVYGGLDCTKTQESLGITFFTWQEAVNEFVRNAV